MKDINKIIQELYVAYIDKNNFLMKELIEKWKSIDLNNPYIKKYEVLYDKLVNPTQNNISPDNNLNKILWKTIKCTNCWSNLSLSEKNKIEIEKWQSPFKFECIYCNSNFFWNSKWFKSLYLNISVWSSIEIESKKYKVSGWVRYSWSWSTNKTWDLDYIERTLVDNSWDIYYLSESKAFWDEFGEKWIECETEISRKIIPEFKLWNFNDKEIFINDLSIPITEKCSIFVVEIYGENSKSYTIGEEVSTYKFNYSWKNYIFEKEKTKSQNEIWIYHTWKTDIDNDFQETKNYESRILNIFFWFVVFLTFWVISYNDVYTKEVTLYDLSNKTLKEAQWLYRVNFSEAYKINIWDFSTKYEYWWIEHSVKNIEWIKFKIESQKDLDSIKDLLSWKIEVKSEDITEYNINFLDNNFLQYLTKNTITNFK